MFYTTLWWSAGLAGLSLWLWAAYRVFRYYRGDRTFRGTWYSEHQFAELVQILYEDQRRGHRVMKHDELVLLRRWQFGKDSILHGRRDVGLFD